MRWLFPRWWRNRYGDELDDLLASTDRPWRDRFDVVSAAARLWLVELEEHGMKAIRISAVIMVVVGVVSVGWAASQLRYGVLEIPGHWWSTLAALPLVLGLALAAFAWWPAQRR